MDGLERYHKLLKQIIEDQMGRQINTLRNEVYSQFALNSDFAITDEDGAFLTDSNGDYVEAL